MNEKHPDPDSQRKPAQIIPTSPPPPPARAPEPSNPDAPDTEPVTPATQRMASPAHAPSRRPGGRAQVPRKDSPPEGTPVIIDRARAAPPLARDRKTAARAQAGITGAISGANITIVG
jgi:hypothetical protein